MSNSKTRHRRVRGGVFRKTVVCLSVLAVVGLGIVLPGTSAGQAGTPPKAAQETKPAPITKPASAANPTTGQARPAPSAVELETWRQTILHTQRPKKSCYVANYPDTAWTEVACTKPPTVPQRLASGPGANTVGNNSDDSAQLPSNNYISQSEGLFASATGITSETGGQCPNPDHPTTPLLAPNAFTLQLNTNSFYTKTWCSLVENKISDCAAEEQFLFSNSQCGKGETNFPALSSHACVYIQYWLQNYGPCPTNLWNISPPNSCYINSTYGTPVPQQVVTNAELESLKLTASNVYVQEPVKLSSGGGGEVVSHMFDTVTLAIGPTVYSLTGDNVIPELWSSWSASEFNIFGDGCSTKASFNTGTALQVQTTVDTAGASAPTCSGQGYTLETNNLELGLCSSVGGASPGIAFTEVLEGSAAGNTVVLYNPDAGQGDVVGFNGAGKQIRYVPHSPWRTTWDKAVVGDFTGEKLGKEMVQQVLLYDQNAGQADVVGFNGNGDQNLDTPNPEFGKSWDKIVTGDFLGVGKQQVLLYDRNAGQLALVTFDSHGVANKPVLNNGFSTSYDKIVAGYFTTDKREQVVLYDRNAGRIDVVAFDTKGGVSMAIPNKGFSTSYDKIVAGYFLGDQREQVVLYDPSAGRLDLVAFDSKGGVSMDTPNKGFRATYDKIVAGYFTGEKRRFGVSLQMVQQILLYDPTAGEADVVAFDTKGNESLDVPNKGFRTTWDKIVVGDFIGDNRQQALFYDLNAGEADVVAFDSKGRESLDGQNSGYRGSRDLIVAGAFLGN